MAHSRQHLGSYGEAIARRFLEARGWVLRGTNVRTPFGEIDLIFFDGTTLVFVEVKTRRSVRYGTPQDAITPLKQRHLAAAIAFYCEDRRVTTPYRCDVIALLLTKGAWSLEHFRNIELSPS